MTLMEQVQEKLVASPAVTALVATRIYPSVAPQGMASPRVVVTVVSDVPESTLNSAAEDELKTARVQVDCYAKQYLDAHAVATAVMAVLGNLARPAPELSAWLESGPLDFYDDSSGLHRVSSDYTVMR